MKKRELLYIPNIIGYLRISFLILFLTSKNPIHQLVFMSLNLSLDVLDGKLARLLNQTSLLGARFDLIIDMFSLSLLSIYVATLSQNPWIAILFIFCGINELINYTLSILIFYGESTTLNHKQEIGKKGFLLPIYYSGLGLAFSNIFHDVYLLTFFFWPTSLTFLVPVFLAGFIFRQCCLVEQAYLLFRIQRKIQALPENTVQFPAESGGKIKS